MCADDEVAADSVLDLVDGLVAKSVLLRAAEHGKARYRLLDTIGEFGLRKLRAVGGERELRVRHRGWYAGLAAKPEAFGPRRAEWLAALDTDHENLRAALEFSLSVPGEAAAGAELACDLWRYWETHGHLTEGRRILAALLEQLDESAKVRLRAMWIAGYLAMFQSDLPAARALLEAALSAANRAGDVLAIAHASAYLGYILYFTGEADQGHELMETALRLHRETADAIGVTMSLLFDGVIHLCSGEPHEAADRFGECVRLAESSGTVWSLTHAQWGLAVAAWLLGDQVGAKALACAGLRSAHASDDPIGVAQCLDALAWIAASDQQAARALTLLGAADVTRAAIPASLPPAIVGYHEVALGAARAALPESSATAAFAKGSAMSLTEALRFALGEASTPAPGSPAIPAGASLGQLTRREQEVAALVARGLSNSQIAAALVISARTVETHVEHIMDKLGVSTRAQIAAWSTAQPQASPHQTTP